MSRDRFPPVVARPVLERGQGFGNRLFPWARCRVFAHRTGAATAAPLWFRPAVGPFLRGGIALGAYGRQILLLGLFRPGPGEATWREGVRLAKVRRVVEEPADLARAPEASDTSAVLVEFRGWRRFFEPLNGFDEHLLARLREITVEKHLRRADAAGAFDVGVNVRIGNDFGTPPPDATRIAPGDKTPLPWFARLLARLREEAGRPLRAVVVSDGTPAQLEPLLRIEGVTLLRPGCAISDLLVLSRCRVLLASGSSSFSAWAAFLGQTPTASHPGQPLTDWRISPRLGQFLGEVDPASPPPEFLASARRALAGPE